MRLELDAGACDAHGLCTVVAPELFDLGDDDDVATVRTPVPGKDMEGSARAAVHACPNSAITLVRDTGEG